MRRVWWACAAAAWLGACDDEGNGGAAADASVAADGAVDGARPDAARPDAARPDAATADGAVPDASRPDAAPPDAARPDAPPPDAALADAATPDAAAPDALPPDPPRCAADADCAPGEWCDECARSSCPVCDDCISACVPHACETEPQPACDEARPDCPDGQVSVVRGGCWLCVERGTCRPPPANACEAAGGYCAHFQDVCRDGFEGGAPMDCPLGRSGQCCLPAMNCVGAGGSIPVVPNAPSCCPGLAPIGCDRPDAAGQCQGGCVGASVCAACGDGVCGPGENVCNCPADCR
jgi:hypothetical protein